MSRAAARERHLNKLHNRQSEIILKFPRKKSRPFFLKTLDIYIQMSREFNCNFSFVVEKILELGYPKNIDVSTLKIRTLSLVSTLIE